MDHESLLRAGPSCQEQEKPIGFRAEATLCEMGLMVSWGECKDFPAPCPGRRNVCWLEAA